MKGKAGQILKYVLMLGIGGGVLLLFRRRKWF